jgi:hypothetical protein
MLGPGTLPAAADPHPAGREGRVGPAGEAGIGAATVAPIVVPDEPATA